MICFSITIEHYDMIQVPIESQEAKLFNGMHVQTPPATINEINAVQGRNLKHPNNFVGHCMFILVLNMFKNDFKELYGKLWVITSGK